MKISPYLLAALASAILAIVPAGAQETTCAKLGASDIKVTLDETLLYRLPASRDLKVSPACRQEAEGTIASWRTEDAEDFQELANRVCSYKMGWEEIEHCPAGGPPPICKANHWRKVDPPTAFARYQTDQLKTYHQRREKLIRSACRCRRAELDKSDISQSESEPDNHQIAPSYQSFYGMYTVPCENCPPGTSCHAGSCRPDNPVEHIERKSVEKLADQAQSMAQDKLQEQAIKFFSKTLYEFGETFGGKVIGGVVSGLLDSTSISTDRDLYENEMSAVALDANNLKNLYQEYDDYKAGKPARGPDNIVPAIDRAKKQLTEHVSMLNLAYYSVTKQQELHSDECYEVFEYQQKKINQAFAEFMGARQTSQRLP